MIPATVRTRGAVDDGWEHPSVAPDGTVALDPGEQLVGITRAKELYVSDFPGGRRRQLVRLLESATTVWITDRRVAWVCDNYDIVGDWIGLGPGGVEGAGIAIAVSRRAVTARSVRTAMVGQLRYPWIRSVGGKDKQRWLEDDSVNIVGKLPDGDGGHPLALQIELFPGIGPNEVARDIANNAAAYRLKRERFFEADIEELRSLERLAASRALTNKKGGFAYHNFPTYFRIGTGRNVFQPD